MRIGEIDTEVYAAAHRADLRPDRRAGPLDERLAAVRAAEDVPARTGRDGGPDASPRHCGSGCVGPTGLAELPEQIEFEIARDVAWSGFNYYLGGFASRVAVNADIGHRMSQFGVLVAHECYPGHHTEHCRKEDLLVKRVARPSTRSSW